MKALINCPHCQGACEINERTCSTCRGTGEVTYSFTPTTGNVRILVAWLHDMATERLREGMEDGYYSEAPDPETTALLTAMVLIEELNAQLAGKVEEMKKEAPRADSPR